MMKYKIIGKYIRNLNFEIPNPKIFFLLSKEISNYKIKIDIKSNQVKEKIIEIETSLSLNSIKEADEKVNTKIQYSTIVEIINDKLNKTELEEIILIKIPTEIYPEIRRIFIRLFEDSGFKDIKIDQQVDFRGLYNSKKIQ